jgi:hypothetical protein
MTACPALWLLVAQLPAADPAIAAAAAVSPERVVRAITALQTVPGATRVTGTPGAEAGRGVITEALGALGLTPRREPFTVRHPFARGAPTVAVNLTVRIGPDAGPARLYVAHLDTKAAEDPAQARALGWRWARDPAPGADDDGSGAAALLELARVLAPWSECLARPVVLAWSDAEELARVAKDAFMEGYGGEALAEALPEVEAALAVDMLLRPRPYGYWLRLYGDGRWASALLMQDILLAGAAVAPELILDPRVEPGFTYSDHGAFWARGQGGALLIEDDFHHPRYHRAADLYAPDDPFYDAGQVVAATRLLAAAALLGAGVNPGCGAGAPPR